MSLRSSCKVANTRPDPSPGSRRWRSKPESPRRPAQATWTQALPDWIDAHVRAFEAIGGVPELVVPDNTKTAIVQASFYDPPSNRTYAEMAAHYRTAILTARPRTTP